MRRHCGQEHGQILQALTNGKATTVGGIDVEATVTSYARGDTVCPRPLSSPVARRRADAT